MTEQPRVIDDDMGGIDVIFNGRELRGWFYVTDDERRTKMLCAREYIEGWCDGREAASLSSTERPHDSDCAVNNAPALPVGPCNCSVSSTDGTKS